MKRDRVPFFDPMNAARLAFFLILALATNPLAAVTATATQGGATVTVGNAQEDYGPGKTFEVDVDNSVWINGSAYGPFSTDDARDTGKAPGNSTGTVVRKIHIKGCYSNGKETVRVDIQVDVTFTRSKKSQPWTITSMTITSIKVSPKKRKRLVAAGGADRGVGCPLIGGGSRYGLLPNDVLEVAGDGIPTSHYPLPPGPHAAAAADLDGDGNEDIAVTSEGAGMAMIYWGNGACGFTPSPLLMPPGFAPSDVLPFDVDGNGDPDLLVVSADTNETGVLMHAGGQSFAWVTMLPTPGLGNSSDELHVLASEHGSDADWGWVDRDAGWVQVMDGLTPTFGLAVGGEVAGFSVRNFDGTGADDLAIWNETANAVVVFRGGDSGYDPGILYPIAAPILSVHGEDVDADGDIDLAVETVFGIEVLSNDGDGLFF